VKFSEGLEPDIDGECRFAIYGAFARRALHANPCASTGQQKQWQ